uniref:Uncharacterized protein n=1 Tax=Arundo donax TaxID=35708 RepID=A0A0A9G4J6_ARUDO
MSQMLNQLSGPVYTHIHSFDTTKKGEMRVFKLTFLIMINNHHTRSLNIRIVLITYMCCIGSIKMLT